MKFNHQKFNLTLGNFMNILHVNKEKSENVDTNITQVHATGPKSCLQYT